MPSLIGVEGGDAKPLSVERFIKLSLKPEKLLKRREKFSILDILIDFECNEDGIWFGI